jgi:fermentation-respiration switch protein FrsA (DUF1100 family)
MKYVVYAFVTAIFAIAAIAVFQRSFIYFPDKKYYQPKDVHLQDVQEISLQTPDGVRIIAWYLAPAQGKPTFLYFHGNGGGLVNRVERFRLFQKAGYGLFMPSYRGYSGNKGKPTETALFADAKLAYDHLLKQGVKSGRIVLFGESLGTGVAVHLAAEKEVKVAAVVLDAPFTSLVAIGQEKYPWLPVGLLLQDRFDSISVIKQIDAPLLVMQGSTDQVIPVSMAKKLYATASEPKEMKIISGAGHSNIFAFDAMPELKAFIEKNVLKKKQVQEGGAP